MEKFSSFITEQKEEPYKVVCFYQSDKSRDVVEKEHIDMMKNFAKAGVDFEYFDYTGSFITEKGDKTFLNGFPIDEKTKEYIQADKNGKTVYRKPYEINQEDTLILYRDLPSGGKIYGQDSPLYSGKVDIKYMTAKEEDILTSQNLIKKV